MMTAGHCLHYRHFSILKKRTLGVTPPPPTPRAYGLYARDNDENYGRSPKLASTDYEYVKKINRITGEALYNPR